MFFRKSFVQQIILSSIIVLKISTAYAQVGKVGINTTSPAAMLHVKDSSVLFTGPAVLPVIPGNPPMNGAGTRLMWFPNKSAFRAGTVTGTYWDLPNIGLYSTAFGRNTIASGESSTTFGVSNTASGIYSVAGGSGNTASGNSSTVFGGVSLASGHYAFAHGFNTEALGYATTTAGIQTKATGNGATAFGKGTQANGYASTVIGTYNDTIVSTETIISPNSPLFIIGNGAINARSNALTVLKNGRAGINTSVPQAMLHVQDSSVVFTGAPSLPAVPGNPPVSGAGARMMWYPNKAAFRVGLITGGQWNKDSIGDYTFAGGYNAKATGAGSIAFGWNAKAINSISAAFGNETVASGTGSTAFGSLTTASGFYSTAIGLSTKSSGQTSFSSGENTVASGNLSTAFGRNTKSKSFASVAIGSYNDSTSTSSIAWIASDPLFIIGNGTSNNSRSNALTVLKNGNIGIKTTTPGYPLSFPNEMGDKIALFGQSSNHYGLGIQASLFQIYCSGAADNIAFGYGESAAFTERMRIKGDGNVGIGTTTPDYKLDVNGRVRIESGGTLATSPGIWLNEVDNSGLASFIGLADANHLGIFNEPNGSWDFFMNITNGNVGVGAFPAQKLHVAGNGLFTGTVTANCGVLACSDIRYKKNINPLSNSLSNVLSLNGIYYNWDNEKFADKAFNDKRQIGFSAQELETLYPEMVHTDDDGYKAVDYSRLTPVLVEAMKEQQQMIKDQQETIDFLLQELASIKQQISQALVISKQWSVNSDQ